MKRISILIAAGLVSCTNTPQTSSTRAPNATRDPLMMVSPITHETFWSEYQAAKPGLDPKDQTNSKFRNGVFYRWLKANPVAMFRDLREKSPVLKLDQVGRRAQPSLGKNIVVLSSGADIFEVLKSPKVFPLDAEPLSWVMGLGSRAVGRTDNLWLSAFAGRGALYVREVIAPLVAEALENGSYVGKDEMGRPFGRIEFVGQLGRKVPYQINERVYGLTGLEMREAADLSRSLEDDLLFNPDSDQRVRERAQKSYDVLDAYLTQLLDGRIQPAPGTILAELQARFRTDVGSSPRLPAAERRTMVKLLAGLLAGVENSQSSVAHALEQLMLHGQIERAQSLALAHEDEALRRMMYEALRFNPVSPYTLRKVAVPVTLASGLSLKPGTTLIVGTLSAMFDESVVPDPYTFKPDRSFREFLHFRRSGLAQIRDQVTEIESFEILKALLKKPGLRRAEGAFGEIDERRPITAHLISKNKNRMSFPERWDLVYDVPGLRDRFEIANKDYMYEDYLRNFDRLSFRLCLGGLKDSQHRDRDGAVSTVDQFVENMKEIGRIIKQSPTIYQNFSVTKLNRTQENKHLLYCRMPDTFRKCVEAEKIDILSAADLKLHQSKYAACQSNLTDLEKSFYENVFFGQAIDRNSLHTKQAQRPADDSYYYEDQLKFYDRYSARESMMTPVGFVMEEKQILFYVRLNIDFRMCLGAPVLKNKYTMGLFGNSRRAQFDACKDGQINPENFRREGALTDLEKRLYEKIML